MAPSSPSRKDCCQQPTNLRVMQSGDAGVVTDTDGRSIGRADLTIAQCAICGARHHELSVDPIPLGVGLAAVG